MDNPRDDPTVPDATTGDDPAPWRPPPPPPPIPPVLREPSGRTARAGRDSVDNGLTGMGKAWGTALDFMFTILAGAGLGWLVGRWQGHTPGWVLGGLALGFVVAFVRIVRSTAKEERAARERTGRGT